MSDNDLIRRGDLMPTMNKFGFGGTMMADAIAALPAASPEPVAASVKPLAWEPSIIGKPWHSAKCPWGFYYAQWDDETKAWFASLEMGEVDAPIILSPSDVPTIDEAKDAAQADYDARILSAITARPEAEVRAEAWADAVEAAADCCDVAAMDHIGDIVRGKGDEIRALTPPDDIAPLLAQRDARIREQALREAADGIKDLIAAAGDAGLQDRREGLRDALDVILALIGGDA